MIFGGLGGPRYPRYPSNVRFWVCFGADGGPAAANKNGGTPLRPTEKDRMIVTLAMHKNFCKSFQISLADKMCVEAWPNGSVPFGSWWSMMHRTKFVQGWQKALSKIGVDNDILEELSTENEVWECARLFHAEGLVVKIHGRRSMMSTPSNVGAIARLNEHWYAKMQ